MAATYTLRDRAVARQTHKLFWEATKVDTWGLVAWSFTRPTALLIYNVIIPFQVAFGLQAIITRHFDQVDYYAYGILISGIAYSVYWAVGGVAICRNGRFGTEYLQQKVFNNFLQKDYEFYNNTYLGSLGSQATRLKDAYNEYCTLFMNGVTKQVIIVGTSIAIIAYQSVVLAIVALISMVLILSFTLVSGRWRLKYRRQLSQANSEVAGLVGDALSHGATVKSFAAEGYEQAHLSGALRRQVTTQYWSWMSSIPADVGRMLLAAVATMLLLILTARMYQQQSISIAIVVLVQLYVVKLVNATQEIADILKAYESIMGNAHAAILTMLVQPHITDKLVPHHLPDDAQYHILLQQVTYRYSDGPGAAAAIHDFGLTIRQGEKVGLVGYSGSGKTTLTKLLLRFMDVSEGSIQIGGVDIRDLAQHELRRSIAYVPQEPLLFHRSIAENIAYGRPDADADSVRLAGAAAYVDEFIQDMAQGYDTLVGEKGVKLSGGQRQRVAIARALLKDAPILVLDEATSALDSKSEQYIQRALWRLMKDRTALVIAHRLSTIQRMDRIVVMDKGKIVQVGSHDELLAQSGIYAKLWEHQSGGYLVGPIKDEA